MKALNLEAMSRRYYTDKRILAAEEEYERTFNLQNVVTIALAAATALGLAVSLILELGNVFIGIFILGTLIQYLYFRHGTKKLNQASRKVLDAIDTVGQENHQIIEDYFANLRRQEAVADETAE